MAVKDTYNPPGLNGQDKRDSSPQNPEIHVFHLSCRAVHPSRVLDEAPKHAMKHVNAQQRCLMSSM